MISFTENESDFIVKVFIKNALKQVIWTDLFLTGMVIYYGKGKFFFTTALEKVDDINTV
jgi:phosphomevalonate kinase